MSEQNKIDEIKARYIRVNPFADIHFLLQEIERKDEALRFYANRENYWSVDFRIEVVEDAGNRAREAL